MSDNGYLVWLIAMAVMTITILTVGTLASAGILRRSDRHPEEPPPERAHELEESGQGTGSSSIGGSAPYRSR